MKHARPAQPILAARRLQAYVLLLINVLTTGATLTVVKWGLSDTTPFRFLFYRFTIGLLLCVPVLFYYRSLLRKKFSTILKVIGVELVGTTAALGVLYIGLTQTSSLEANLILTCAPVCITVGAIVFLREKVTKKEWVGLTLATTFMLLIMLLPGLTSGDGFAFHSVWGNFLIVSQNILTVVYMLSAKKVFHTLPKLLTTSMSILVGFFSFSLFSFFEAGGNTERFYELIQQDLQHPSVWIIAIFAAVFTSIIGLTAYMKAQDLIEVSEASLFGYLQPIVFVPLGYLVLKESIQPIQLVCFIGVLIGVWLAEWKPLRHSR